MAKKENNYYFDSFAKGIAYANDAARLLQECFENYDAANVQVHLDEMHQIEHSADGVKHDIMEKLMKEFLPPLEREDIVELIRAIDDVTDSVEDVLRGAYIYNITSLRSEVKEFVDLIVRTCKALESVAVELHNFRKSTILTEKIKEINSLEEEGDRLFTEAMRRLYTEEKDAVTIIAWGIMYNRLEKCCDFCEDVADVVEQVVLKNS